MYDWEEIERLIRVVDALRGHPNLKPLADAAMTELHQIATPAELVEDEEPDDE